MTDVLDQSDIDALLRAVDAGEIDAIDPPEAHIFSRGRRGLERIDIREYDFKRPERISKDQMRALQTMHETFARNFGASLSGFMRTIVEVEIASATQMTYSEFIGGLPNPTSFNLIDADELDGQLCLEVSPLIIYPVIDRLLGGSNQDVFIPQRPMTLIETRLIKTILERALTALSEAWESLRTVEFRNGEMESNPQIMQIVPPNEVVVVIQFEIRMAERTGTMSLCIPFNVIEPMIDELSAQSWFLAGRHHRDEHWDRIIAGRLTEAQLDLSGVLAETMMTLSELRSLEVGDLITTGTPASDPVLVRIGGHPKFYAHIGNYKGRRALKILRAVKASDRVGR